MRKNRLLVFVILFLLFVTTFRPTTAAWGAGWGSGSVIGFSTGTVPYSDGTKVKAIVAPPACTNFHDEDDCYNDPDTARVKRNFSRFGAAPSNPNMLTGAVFCKRLDNEPSIKPLHGDDEGAEIRRGGQLAQINFNIVGSTNLNNHSFSVHASVPQSILDSLDAKSLCSKPDDDKVKSHSYSSAKWKIIDFVPREFSAAIKVAHETKVFSCQMSPSDFASLSWDRHAGHPTKKPYQC